MSGDSVWPPRDLLSQAVGRPVRESVVQPLSGDNFASAALKVKTTTDQGVVRHIIIKRLAENADEVYPIRPAFEVEGRMYAEVMPRMMELLRGAGKDSPPLGPRMLLRIPEPEPSLFFEDISVDGFRLASREGGLDVAHVRLMMRSLARWHAAGAVLLDREPALFRNMPRMVCEEHGDFVDGMLVKGLTRFLKHAQEWTDELSQRVVAKLRLLQPSCRQRILDAHRPAPLGKGFNVALHGDLWTGNILFKYDNDGKPIDVRFIDYQLSTWGSPSSDIMYFYSGASGEARLARDDIIAEYHAEMASCLQALGAKLVPTLADIKADLRRRAMIEVMHTTAGSPIIMAPHSIGLVFENVVDVHKGTGPHPRDEAIRYPPLQKMVKLVFEAWEKEGVLDELIRGL